MAGREAEEEIISFCRGGDGDDRYQIDLMLETMLPPDADLPSVAKRMRSMTRHLVHRHRGSIERVAELLLEHGKLSAGREGDEVILASAHGSLDRSHESLF